MTLSVLFSIILACLAIMAASLVGVVTVWKGVGSFVRRHLSTLVSFSAGIFLIIALELSAESIHVSPDISVALGSIFFGIFILFLLFKAIPHFHHHHDDEKEESHTHNKIDARRIIASDAIHNIGDGLLVAATFIAEPRFGIITAIGVFIHELVQEISEFFVLRQSGYSTKRALFINFAVSSTILVGALIGFLFIDLVPLLEGPILGLAAGSFFVVVLIDLIPHTVRASKTENRYGKYIAAFVLGVIVMFGLNAVAGHAHDEDSYEHDEEHVEEDHAFLVLPATPQA